MLARQNLGSSLDDKFMLDAVHTRFEGIEGLALINRHATNENRRTAVHFSHYFVDHDACMFNLTSLKGFISTLNGIRTVESARQGWVQVYNRHGFMGTLRKGRRCSE